MNIGIGPNFIYEYCIAIKAHIIADAASYIILLPQLCVIEL